MKSPRHRVTASLLVFLLLPLLVSGRWFVWKTASTFSSPNSLSQTIAWFDVDTLSGADNTAQSSWTDSSASANTATDLGGSYTDPVKKTSILNGHPILRFGGSNSELITAASHSLPNKGHLFMVMKITNGTAANPARLFDGTASSNIYIGFDEAVSSGQIGVYTDQRTPNGWNNGSANVDNVWALVEIAWTATTLKTYVNGFLDVDISQTGSATGTHYQLELGGRADFGQFMSGDMADVVLCNDQLTGSDLTNLRSYLTTKFGL